MPLNKSILGISSSEKVMDALKQIIKKSSSSSTTTKTEIQELESMILKQEASESQETNDYIPLKAISIAKSIAEKESLLHAHVLEALNAALQNSTLVYSKPNDNDKNNDNDNNENSTTNTRSKAYQSRIQKLKLAEQEKQYSKITKNLNSTPEDDETIKSMMYAASVGMNMIVAPISIGVIMYFFAGKLFAFIIPDYQQEKGKINIHGVIAGVLVGVIMLFIEMILFVIRNHEMDKFVTKKIKRRKNHMNPFGYDKRTAERTFQG